MQTGGVNRGTSRDHGSPPKKKRKATKKRILKKTLSEKNEGFNKVQQESVVIVL